MIKQKVAIQTTKQYLIALDDNDADIDKLKNSSNIEVIQDYDLSVRWHESRFTVFAFNSDGIADMLDNVIFKQLPYHYVASKCGFLFILSEGKFYQHDDNVKYGHDMFIDSIKKSIRNYMTTKEVRMQDCRKYSNLTSSRIVKDGNAIILSSFKRLKYYQVEDGFCYRFRLHCPRGNEGKVPLIIYFDGAGHPGYDNTKQLGGVLMLYRRLLKEKRNCYILAPQLGLTEAYTTDIHSKVLWEMIVKIADDEGNIDMSRIYLIGCSYGGYGAIYEAFRHPERYAAVIPTVGWIYLDESKSKQRQLNYYLFGTDKYHLPFDLEGLKILAKVPIWLACSNIELKYNETLYNDLKSLDADVNFTRDDRKGHAMSIDFLANTLGLNGYFLSIYPQIMIAMKGVIVR